MKSILYIPEKAPSSNLRIKYYLQSSILDSSDVFVLLNVLERLIGVTGIFSGVQFSSPPPIVDDLF